MQQAILAGGCFWCTEAFFAALHGVKQVQSGYVGGTQSNPTYEQVCTGQTGHTEAIRIDFDETQISYPQLLDVFFAAHDPTTLNRQGNDIGTQYRSAIFYLNEQQKQHAQTAIERLKQQGLNVVTQVKPLDIFYPAESYHQRFFANNPYQPYCNYHIPPKLKQLKQRFPQLFRSVE